MLTTFIISLFATFFLVRILSHLFHDKEGYGTEHENSKTLTGFMRKLTGFDLHHIHLGIVLLIIDIALLALFGFKMIPTILLAISLSMIADQATPLIDREKSYFSIEKTAISFMFHIIIALTAILIIRFMPS